jgi:hypothetical protein
VTEYDTTELSRDPADYLTGPTGNQISRTSGGTNREGQIARVVEDDSVLTQPGQAGPTETGTGEGAPASGGTAQQ